MSVKSVLCFSNPAYLSLRNKQLVVEVPAVVKSDDLPALVRKECISTRPIEDIGVIILDNRQITITQPLMAALLDQNCAIITCNDTHHPVGLFLPLDGHNLQSERFREQLDASEPLRKQLWQQTVVSKIEAQAYVLRRQGLEHKNMLAWSRSVRSGDTENMEGRAAAYYWRTIFGDPAFVRGQNGDPPNNLLNYGYAIIRAMMARSLVAAGLLPTLGIHHHNRYNAYCLADDIMEPYRALVDLEVLSLCAQYGCSAEAGYSAIETLTPALKRALLGLSTVDITIDGHRSPLMMAMQTTANSIQRCFSGEARKIIYPDWQNAPV